MQSTKRYWLGLTVAFLLGLSIYGIINQINHPQFELKPAAVSSASNSVTQVAQNVSPSVVGVINYTRQRGDYFSTKTTEKYGSGVIIHSDGLIVTNNHVVQGATRLVVVLANGDQKEAKLMGRDARTDLALIKVPGKKYKAARLGASDKLQVGETVVAIGNPLGMQFARSVTAGVVSGLNRVINTEEGYLMRLIQTDAAINPGNSGGALVNIRGELVGINTVKINVTGFEGMGFAVPSKQVAAIAEQIMRDGKVSRAAMGLKMLKEIAADDVSYYHLPVKNGIVVMPINQEVARRTGLKENDIIQKVDGQSINRMDDLQEYIMNCKVGQQVQLEVVRMATGSGGEPQVCRVKLRLGDEADFMAR
ncbi:MAG: S1C family serine protease [Methylocystaceae bacterium]